MAEGGAPASKRPSTDASESTAPDAAAGWVTEYTLYLTLAGRNACLLEGEGMASFRKGLLMLAVMQGLREEGFILDTDNLEVLLAGRATPGGEMQIDLEQPAASQQLAVYVPPTPSDVVNWKIAVAGGRAFEPSTIVVLMKLCFTPGDLPVGTCIRSHLNMVCRALNQALQNPDSMIHGQLRPIDDLIVVGLNNEPVGYQDSKEYVAAQEYRKKVADTTDKLMATHNASVDALHGLKALQAQMIRSLKSGRAGYSTLKDEYRHLERHVLAATSQDLANSKKCLEEDTANATASLKTCGVRREVATATEAVERAQGSAVLKQFRAAPYPSEQLKCLKGIHHEIVQSSFDKADAPSQSPPGDCVGSETVEG
eukprot:TRINITY_DN22643_c0_g1_i1.p1 TRINITY_DN22643_c0_g1~~TRINITY_DN22643_c0_g1_i1.p1  ORF type:complete len:384 (+),score=157.75 TRINITY_DN22643_c0_g1_i1:47-1153(+)